MGGAKHDALAEVEGHLLPAGDDPQAGTVVHRVCKETVSCTIHRELVLIHRRPSFTYNKDESCAYRLHTRTSEVHHESYPREGQTQTEPERLTVLTQSSAMNNVPKH